MPSPQRWFAITFLAATIGAICVLGLYRTTVAAPRTDNQPFANAVEQRMEIISQLKELNALLKEQNELLRSGSIRVVVDDHEEK